MRQADISGTARDLVVIRQADASGVVRELSQVWQADAAGVAHLIYSAGPVTGSGELKPDYVNGYGSGKGLIYITTDTATASFSGTPASVTWIFNTDGWAAVNPMSLSTPFRSPRLAGDEDSSTDVQCRIVAENGDITLTNSITAYAQNNGESYGSL